MLFYLETVLQHSDFVDKDTHVNLATLLGQFGVPPVVVGAMGQFFEFLVGKHQLLQEAGQHAKCPHPIGGGLLSLIRGRGPIFCGNHALVGLFQHG